MQLVSCFGCLVWSYFRLPECKGRTFRELDIMFENRVPTINFKETQVNLGVDRTEVQILEAALEKT